MPPRTKHLFQKRIAELLHQAYSGQSFFGHSAEELFPTSISETQGKFLQQILQTFHPQTLIELGCGYGLASLWLQSTEHSPQKHWIIDPYLLESNRSGEKVIKEIEKNNVIFIDNLSSQEFLCQLNKTAHGKIDFIFHDADERFDGLMTDIYFSTKLLQVGGILVIRNSWNPSVRKAVHFALRNLSFSLWNSSPLERTLIDSSWLGNIWLRFFAKHKPSDFYVLVKNKEDDRTWNHFRGF